MPKPIPTREPELQRRIEVLEHSDDAGELTPASWFWLLLFGVATPAALLLWGWWT